MTEVVKVIDPEDVKRITEAIEFRQVNFGEDSLTSVAVVLLNYGERYVRVHCLPGEWSGTKGDLQPRRGIPLCPNGHPLLELGDAPRLALIAEDD